MSTFTLDISRFCDKAEGKLRETVRKIALDAFSGVILKTPVDTGRARANWSVSVDRPNIGTTTEATDKSGAATVQKAREGVNGWSGNGSIFLCNSIKYIGPLEYGGFPNPPKLGTRIKNPDGSFSYEIRSVGGFSRQHPNGMVRVTIEEMQAWAQKAGQGE